MNDTTWEQRFRGIYDRGLAACRAGRRSPSEMFGPDDVAFLASLGCSPREVFDFVEDYLDYNEPDFATALRITAVRRDYFLRVQHGKPTGRTAPASDLPAKSDAVDGIPWLPRLIAKARLKLRGELPDELMYGCGGDRPFLRRMGTDLPSFLELVRDSGDDDRRIVDAVKQTAGLSS
ncbi:MAG: DUF5069 domain-containing protein [Verrucomicrobia bacterium]|nr:MAG: DUF5069 domain-containing protein [Verrucomicrobiota bacterium]